MPQYPLATIRMLLDFFNWSTDQLMERMCDQDHEELFAYVNLGHLFVTPPTKEKSPVKKAKRGVKRACPDNEETCEVSGASIVVLLTFASFNVAFISLPRSVQIRSFHRMRCIPSPVAIASAIRAGLGTSRRRSCRKAMSGRSLVLLTNAASFLKTMTSCEFSRTRLFAQSIKL